MTKRNTPLSLTSCQKSELNRIKVREGRFIEACTAKPLQMYTLFQLSLLQFQKGFVCKIYFIVIWFSSKSFISKREHSYLVQLIKAAEGKWVNKTVSTGKACSRLSYHSEISVNRCEADRALPLIRCYLKVIKMWQMVREIWLWENTRLAQLGGPPKNRTKCKWFSGLHWPQSCLPQITP